MTTPIWPAGLPQRPKADRFSFTPQSNKISFQPKVGPSLDHRMSSSKVRIYDVGFDIINNTQLQIFLTWFEVDLKGGYLSFTWIDPTDSVNYLWKFSSDENPYQVDYQRGIRINLSMKLTRLAAV